MSRIVNDIPEQLLKRLEQLGYRSVKAEDQRVFDPYYDKMNGHWSSAASFLCIQAWRDAVSTFYKPVGNVLCCVQYDGTLGEWMALPFTGRYSSESFENAFRVFRADMETLGFPLKVMFLSEWELPFYQRARGISWEIENPRNSMEYIYQRTDFVKSINSSDSRYRYRYFLRRFAPETVVLTPEHREECLDCMRAVWCPFTDCSNCYACPLDAVGNVVSALDYLRADGLLVRVNGKPAGLCIVSCRNGLGLYMFKHADNRMKGINEYLLCECFTRFLSEAEEINYTADIGDEGLRAYKSKLAPYTLSPCLTLYRKRDT